MKRSFEHDESTEERSSKILCINNSKPPQHDGDLNQILFETTTSIINLLIKRATIYAKQSRFTDALNDARLVITQSPTLAQGYLLAGNIYSDQGKENQAIKVLQEGIEQISAAAKDDSQYYYHEQRQPLEALLTRSKQKSERRIDFVKTLLLPVEITSIIWFFVGVSESLIESMLTSKTWREMILHSFHVWHTIRTYSIETDTAIVKIMPTVGKHVHYLELQNLRRYYYSPHITYLSYMSDGIFCNLKSLSIDARVDANLLSMALYKIKHTLTKLEVVYDMMMKQEALEENAILPLLDIMDICLNLQELKYVSNGHLGLTRKRRKKAMALTAPTITPDRWENNDHYNNQYQHAKEEEEEAEEKEFPSRIVRLDLFQHLIIDDEEIIKPDELHQITKRCYNLRMIALRNFNQAYLNILIRDCPGIRHVYFVDHEVDIDDDHDLELVQQCDSNKSIDGLRTLHIMSDTVHMQSIWPYLRNNGKTLESLSLLLETSQLPPPPLTSLSSTTINNHPLIEQYSLLPTLKKLTLVQRYNTITLDSSNNESLQSSCILNLFYQCPALEKLMIFGIKLYKSYFCALRETTGSNLKHMLLHTTLGEHGALVPFLCHDTHLLGLEHFATYFLPMKELCLSHLAEIKPLKEIKLGREEYYLSDWLDHEEQQQQEIKHIYLNLFLTKLQQQGRLKVLELDGISYINDNDLKMIAGISSLERVSLQRLNMITEYGLKTMLHLARSALDIKVSNCANISSKYANEINEIL
ncbi:hypothetical protein BDC45DRAFT_604189 [Circinella umbellata]|nr:hypothetical protein BDC45DRAFT_604189 [Circinella umbellata]